MTLPSMKEMDTALMLAPTRHMFERSMVVVTATMYVPSFVIFIQ